ALYNAIDTITKKFIYPLSKLVRYGKQEILPFVPRKKLLSQVWPNGFPSKQLLLKSSPLRQKYSEITIASVNEVGFLTMQTLDSIKTILDDKLAKEKRQQEFIALEERMIIQIKNLNNLIDSVNTSLPPNLLNALKNIKNIANDNLSVYSNMTEQNAKLDLGRNLVNCFDHLEQLEKAILILPAQKEEITTTYQDQIWNPFMANLMNEDLKKRITTAYHKVWLPYLVKEVTSGLSCNNAQDLVVLFSETHKRMLAMREEETKRLERKLKREQDPLVVKELFNLQSAALEDQ
ncbi:MAG: hypothetical protein WBB27_04310, partial [Maribacter sp.]